MKKHIWKFAKFGGVTQLIFETADDILNLRKLDQKLWTVLSMPTSGVFFDKETANFLDTDGDGFIRPPEILDAVDFLKSSLKDVGVIMKEGESLTISDIVDKELLTSAKWLIKKQGKTEQSISVDDVAKNEEIYNAEENLEISDEDSQEDRLHKLFSAYVKENPDNSVDDILTKFKSEFEKYSTQQADLQKVSYGLTFNQMLNAVSSVNSIKNKVDDFFIRCKLLEYDKSANDVLTNCSEIFKTFSHKELTTETENLLDLPIALPNTEKLLDLKSKINPAYISEISDFYANAILTLCGEVYSLNEQDWKNICNKISDFENIYEKQGMSKFSKLDFSYLKEVESKSEQLEKYIHERLIFEKQKTNIKSLKKLLLLRRDFFTLLKNYVSFSAFYSGEGSIFQAGVLYFDSREANLCFSLSEDTRHGELEMLSAAYLVYCDIKRKSEKRKVLCLLTNGTSENIIAGRNGIFYDRHGNDWNATVTNVIASPVSVKEAFFTPYKNLVHFIEENMAKKTGAAQEKSNALIESAASKTVNAPKDAAKEVSTKKLDMGTIALIGTAVGGISTLIGSILQALFGLGYWVPIGVLGLLLIVSGPSMILAAMKLRKRSIGPILEANGWAINTRTKVNIPMGASFTKLIVMPKNSKIAKFDPFAEKNTKKKILISILVIFLILAVIFCYFYFFKKVGANPVKWFKS